MAKSKTMTAAAATKVKKAAAPKAAKTAAPKATKTAAPKATKTAKPAKAMKAKVAAPKAAADTAAKAGTPKAAVKKTVIVAKAVAKKVAPIKLTEKQAEFLKNIHSAGDAGYKADKKAEAKSIESLLGKKLIRKGAKDKNGVISYTVSKAGEKQIGSPSV